jgi:hypothetical protein
MSRARLLLAVPLLLAAACQTVVTPNRVAEGGGQMVTVTAEPFIIPITGCPPDSEVEVFLDDEAEPAGTGTADTNGDFSIPITAPAEPGAYEVMAICNLEPQEGSPTSIAMAPITLIVEPDLVMLADPDQLGPGEEFEVTGTWCVSQDDDGQVPTAAVTFEGETQDFTASGPHPFGESWTATFAAPDEPGTYEVTATCTYDEVDPDVPFDIPDLPDLPGDLTPVEQEALAAAAEAAEPAAVDADYEPVTVEVVVPEEPVEPTEPAPAPRAPEAEPTQGVQPTFVG